MSIVDKLQILFNSVKDIKSAIEEKGGSVDGVTTFADAIREIKTEQSDPLTFVCLEAPEEGSSISIGSRDVVNAKKFFFKKNFGEWEEYVEGSYIKMQPSDVVQFKSDDELPFSTENAYRSFWIVKGKIASYGSISSLTNGKDIIDEYCYQYMFEGCTSLVNAPELPATTLADSCYIGMFSGCTSLVNAPELPATTLESACYSSMFYNCTSLVNAPELPATTLANNCYRHMFYLCTSLVNAPELPATTLIEDCYYGMFQSCTSLVNAPELPATILSKNCYNSMFYGCTSLVNAPELPATTLAYNCYYSMFYGCTSLVNAPELPATTLASSCYRDMFNGCTSLVNAPELLATTLAVGCYFNMFRDCTSLVNAPELTATTLANSCYRSMFNGCTSLNNVKTLFTTKGTNSITDWLVGVSATGTFYKSDLCDLTREEMGIPDGWNVESVNDTLTFECLEAPEEGSYIAIYFEGVSNNKKFRYKKNDGVWTPYDSTRIQLQQGDVVKFKSSDEYLFSSNMYHRHFNMGEGRIAVYGNINSLTNGKDIIKDYCYAYMFEGCKSLVNAPALPATTLASYCYYSMFWGCTSLENAPELPATTLADNCYGFMFYSCESLVNAPALPATTLADRCYYGMFQLCTSLVSAPALPATTLASGCYEFMFWHCESLVTAPELPATTLVDRCYKKMFANCTKLSSVKALFTSIGSNSISNWLENVSLTGTFYKSDLCDLTREEMGIPEGWNVESANDVLTFECIEAPEDGSYICINNKGTINDKQFKYKKNDGVWISYAEGTNIPLVQGDIIKFMSDDELPCSTSNTSYRNFVMGDGKIAAYGSISSLTNQKDIVASYCYYSMFYVCTSLVNAPELPATTLAGSCYRSMFNGCTSLVNAPELPATTLADDCYYYIFRDCTSLVNAPELPATTLAIQCYYGMFYGCTSLVNAPGLSATTLAIRCCGSMFKNCTSLVNAPELPATTLVDGCYHSMFYGCTSLNNVKALFTIEKTDSIKSWLNGVSPTGTFTKNPAATWTKEDLGLPSGWTIVDNVA